MEMESMGGSCSGRDQARRRKAQAQDRVTRRWAQASATPARSVLVHTCAIELPGLVQRLARADNGVLGSGPAGKHIDASCLGSDVADVIERPACVPRHLGGPRASQLDGARRSPPRQTVNRVMTSELALGEVFLHTRLW